MLLRAAISAQGESITSGAVTERQWDKVTP
jgi:hypothetical protein